MPRAQRVAIVENAAVAHDQMDHRGHPGKLVEYGVTYRDTSVLKGLLDPSSARKLFARIQVAPRNCPSLTFV